jgi:hypothetical protein
MYSACRESFVERSILKRLSDTRRKRLRCASESTPPSADQSAFDIRHSNFISGLRPAADNKAAGLTPERLHKKG